MIAPLHPGPLAQPFIDLGICDEPARLLPNLLNPPLVRLFSDWQALAAGGRLPGRSDFPPEKLRYILGNLVLLDVEPDAAGGPPDYRYRLYGSNFSYNRGFDLTGKLLSEHPDRNAAISGLRGYAMVVKRRRPLLARFGIRDPEGRPMVAELAVLPLADDGETVNRLLCGQFNMALDHEVAERRESVQLAYGDSELISLRLRNPDLQRLMMEWQAWRGDRVAPGRADFQPEDLRYLLGKLFLFDIEPGEAGPRFRYRLFGSSVAQFRGFDLTGRHLDEHPDPAFAVAASQAYAPVALARRPLWANVDRLGDTGMRFRFEAVVLPLSSDGENVDMALSAQIMQ
jgi:hypothetical protein